MIETLEDKTLRLLGAISILSLVIGVADECHREDYGYLEGIAIIAVVFAVTMMSSIIDFNKEKKFRELNSVKDNYDVQVMRDGKMQAVAANDILVGDVIELAAGDKVAADAILVSSISGLKTNESAMTGEPIDIKKSAKDPFILSGTTVSEGSCRAMIVATGVRSQWGVILKGLMVEPEDTPLQNRLNTLVDKIGGAGILMAVLTFLASMLRYVIDGDWEDGKPVLDFVLNAVTIVVVAIPEGLPLAITLGLAFAMRKMMRDQNLVRRLEACETMGSATQLNADKTGTLTQNRMTVMEGFFGGKFYSESPEGSAFSERYVDCLVKSMAINSTANLHKTADGAVEHLGSKTECALLQFVENLCSSSYVDIRRDNPATRVYLFTSEKKRMSSLVTLDGDNHRLYCKGASEIVLDLCTKYMQADGGVKDISGVRDEAKNAINKMAESGLRTLCIAQVDVKHSITEEKFWEEAPEEKMCLLGIVGIKDPIRPETASAVRLLRQAGVIVRMVTGDNKKTAAAIAKEAGIMDEGGLVIEGPEFRKMSHEERKKIALDIRVLARSSPHDKLVLAEVQKSMGEVVSVTGDGTNDAPALKAADVGFALGIAGTEIAKEACDIVILDDNIASMAKAVLWGRNVFFSIRKFLQFQLVVNVVAVTLNFIAACAKVDLPLRPVPLLWVNMIMDSMGALALATEPPLPSLMKLKPFGRTVPLINKEMWRNIIGVSIYQFIVCLVFLFKGKDILDIPEHRGNVRYFGFRRRLLSGCEEEDHSDLALNSFIFNAFVMMQVFSEINSRCIEKRNVFKGIEKSKYFIGIILFTIAVQVVLMQGVGSTTVGPAIGFENLDGMEWLWCVLLGMVVIPVGFVTRLVPLSWIPIGITDEETLSNKEVTDIDAKVSENGSDDKPVSASDVKPTFKSVANMVMAANRFKDFVIEDRLTTRRRSVSVDSIDQMNLSGEEIARQQRIRASKNTSLPSDTDK